MKKRYIIYMIIIITTLIFTACQPAPPSVDENGLKRGQSKIEQELNTTNEHSVTVAPSPSVTPGSSTHSETHSPENTPTKTPYQTSEIKHYNEYVNKKVVKNNKTLIIDTTVKIPNNLGELGIYDVEIVSCNTETEKYLLNLFFREYAKNAEYDKGSPYLSAEIDGEKAYLSYNNFSSTFSFFMMDYVDKGNKYLGSATDTQAPGCKINIHEALSKANSLLQRMNVSDFYLISKKAVNQSSVNGSYSKTGHYDYTYEQRVDGLPIFSCDESISMDIYTARASFSIDDNGFRYASLKALKLINKEKINNYLTLDKAISVLENRMGVVNGNYIPISRIDIEYYLTADYNLVPCWAFYVDTGNNFLEASDIYISAVNGEILYNDGIRRYDGQ